MNTWKQRSTALLLGLVLALAVAELLAPAAGWESPLSRLTSSPEGEPIGWFEPSETPPYPWADSKEGIDFLEAAFRYQFEHNMLNPRAVEDADFVFLGLKGPSGLIDPSPELLSRFEDFPSVEPVSAARMSGPRILNHKEKPGRCVQFVIENLRLIDDATVEVGIRYQGGCSSGNVYRFERRDGEWIKVSGGTTDIS